MNMHICSIFTHSVTSYVYYNLEVSYKKQDLPSVALLSLETPRCWHWSLYFDGIFYDPEHGVLEDYPLCNRKFYWEILK